MIKSLMTVTFAAITLVPQALRAQDPRACSNGNIQGMYIMSASGSIVGVGPAALIGLVTYDGMGNGLGTITISLNGSTSTSPPTPVTFNVNRDCTGTMTFGSGAGATNFDFVITPNGSNMTWLVTNPGWSVLGSTVRSTI